MQGFTPIYNTINTKHYILYIFLKKNKETITYQLLYIIINYQKGFLKIYFGGYSNLLLSLYKHDGRRVFALFSL